MRKAGHRIRLGEAVQKNRPFAHAGQGSDADMLAFEGQLGVNLVGDDEQVVPQDHLGNSQQFGARHRAAGRIGREIQHQHFAPRRDRFLDGFGRDGETVFRPAGDRHRRRRAPWRCWASSSHSRARDR